MPDWKEMYLTLLRDTERALTILKTSQQKCEEMYLREDPPPLHLLPRQEDDPT